MIMVDSHGIVLDFEPELTYVRIHPHNEYGEQ